MPQSVQVASSTGGQNEALESAVKLIFSWVLLMPIAVIVGGKLLVQVLRINGQKKQLFQVKIRGILHLHAHDDEVVLGFASFFFFLLILALTAGRPAYDLFKRNFGIDPGQFNALCVLSSFSVVCVSFVLFLITRVYPRLRSVRDPVLREHEDLIEDLAKNDRSHGR